MHQELRMQASPSLARNCRVFNGFEHAAVPLALGLETASRHFLPTTW